MIFGIASRSARNTVRETRIRRNLEGDLEVDEAFCKDMNNSSFIANAIRILASSR